MEDPEPNVPKAMPPWWGRLKDAVVDASQVGSFALSIIEYLHPADADASRMAYLLRLAYATVHAVLALNS